MYGHYMGLYAWADSGMSDFHYFYNPVASMSLVTVATLYTGNNKQVQDSFEITLCIVLTTSFLG